MTSNRTEGERATPLATARNADRPPRAPSASPAAPVRTRARFESWSGAIVAATTLVLGLPAPATAQVVLDGSIGTAGAGSVSTAMGPGGGTDYLIDESDGELRGTNLFHSFDQFDLSATERAIYRGSPSIRTLITRVTGGASSIDGVISSEIAGADLYFLNSAGIVFGETAQVDVTGSFFVSTADRLLLENGDLFETNLSAPVSLSAENVAGFGFLDAPAPIRVEGSRIEMAIGEQFAMVGGDLDVLGLREDGGQALIDARGGRIDLVSLASGGEVMIEPDQPFTISSDADRGDIRVVGATLNTSGLSRNPFRGFLGDFAEGSGPINLQGDDLLIEDGEVVTLTVTDRDAGDVSIDLTGTLTIRSIEGGLQSGIIAGTGLNIEPDEDDVRDPFVPFLTATFPTTQVRITNCTDGACGVRYSADGDAGDVDVTARNLVLEDSGRITARSETRGDAGTIRLAISDSIEIRGVEGELDRSGLSSTADDTGNPGQILIESPDARLVMSDRAAIVIQNSDVSTAASTPGLIDIEVASIDMSGDARIDSSTRGAGDGGQINLAARDFIRLSGRTSDTEFTGITTLSQPGSTGAAGDIRIETARLDLRSGAEIAARPAGPGALGDAGSLTLDIADSLTLREARISTQSDNAAGGNITVDFGQRLVLEDSTLSASVTTGPESGGNVTLRSTPISAAVLSNSTIEARADQGAGGDILLEANLLFVDPESAITASSNAGIDGTVETRAPDGNLIDLKQDLRPPRIEASALLDEPCAARHPGNANSLIVTERAGVALNISALLPSSLPESVYAELEPDSRADTSSGREVEARNATNREAQREILLAAGGSDSALYAHQPYAPQAASCLD